VFIIINLLFDVSLHIYLSDWRWKQSNDIDSHNRHREIVSLFGDDQIGCDLSLHKMMQMAHSQSQRIAVGQWYAPSTAAALIRFVCKNNIGLRYL
jgi:hypothetical protein